MKKLLIIGGVAAGATAAARARRLNSSVEITMLEAGPDVSFANCGLPYYIGGDIQHRSSLILSSPETFYDQYRVTVHTSTEAVSLDRGSRTVRARNTDSGREIEFSYDALILAQGGKPVTPPIPGVDQDHVFQLWTLTDMDRINRFLTEKEPETAVVVGGGFIGLEMVEALAHRGVSVTVVEMEDRVMSTLDPEFSGFLTKEMVDHGVSIRTGTSVASIDAGQVVLSDQSPVAADLVILATGVRPTLGIASDAGLEMGHAGGLLVNEFLKTSDDHIFAAGDMVEIEHRIHGRNVRVPLAGPANRQGRIAAENALGGARRYAGALGTSVVKLFGAVAGSTGLTREGARNAGFDAHAVVVHKTSHTAYFPGAEPVSLMLVYDRATDLVLGAQAAGRVGVDKRIDVLATAIAGGLTTEDLSELDLAYAPPFNSPNGPVNMAAFVALNQKSGFSPSVLAQDLEAFAVEHQPIAIDLRDPIRYRQANLLGSTNLSLKQLRENLDQIPREETILLISDDGKLGHVASRLLSGAGFGNVFNLSGGYISLERHGRAAGFQKLSVGLFPVEHKSATAANDATAATGAAGTTDAPDTADNTDTEGPLMIDVRTPMEFAMGAYPGAINLSLDELPEQLDSVTGSDRAREIILYCASGARSAYGVRLLQQMGYTNVRNGGSLHDVMAMG